LGKTPYNGSIIFMTKGGIVSTPEKNTTDLKGALFEPSIERKPKPGEGFEGPVFKDKPVVKPVVKTPLPTTKTDLEKP
jgi:hypothetical protein